MQTGWVFVKLSVSATTQFANTATKINRFVQFNGYAAQIFNLEADNIVDRNAISNDGFFFNLLTPLQSYK